jgi:hypothetical protein
MSYRLAFSISIGVVAVCSCGVRPDGVTEPLSSSAPGDRGQVLPSTAVSLEPASPARGSATGFEVRQTLGFEPVTAVPEPVSTSRKSVSVPGNPTPAELAEGLKEQQALGATDQVTSLKQMFVDQQTKVADEFGGYTYGRFFQVSVERAADLPDGYVRTILQELDSSKNLTSQPSQISGMERDADGRRAVWISYDGQNLVTVFFKGEFAVREIDKVIASLSLSGADRATK